MLDNYKVKTSMARSAMSSDKLAKTITDALEAPVGSTKRKQAETILKTLRRSAAGFFGTPLDGMGGPGAPVALDPATGAASVPGGAAAQQAPQLNIDKLLVKKPPGSDQVSASGELNELAPPPRTFFIQSVDQYLNESALKPRQRPNFSGSGAEVSFGPEGTALPGPGLLSRGPASRVGGDLLTPTPHFDIKSYPGMPIRLGEERPGEEAILDRGVVPEDSTTAKYGPYTQDEANAMYDDLVNKGKDPNEAAAEIHRITGYTVYSPGSADVHVGDDIDASTVQSILDIYGEDELDTWFNSLDKSAQDYYRSIYEAVKGGVGPQTWALQVMGDKRLLAQILKVPMEQLSGLPDSGLLADQINDLRSAVKKEFQIDTLLDRITSLSNTGANIESDLQAYIRGKDEYLGTIDRLIDEAEEKIAFMDTSNPNVAKRMGNYMNYLTVLQGRQNLRYTDFLTRSLGEHEAELSRLTSLYNLNLKKAEEEFASASAVTEEQYDNLKTGLEDMYSNVEKHREVIRGIKNNALDQAMTYYGILERIADTEKKKKESISGAYDDFDPDKVRKLFVSDKTITSYNPLDVIEGAKGQDQDPALAEAEFYKTHLGNLTGIASGGTFLSELEKYRSVMQNELMGSVTLRDGTVLTTDELAKRYDSLPAEEQDYIKAQLDVLQRNYSKMRDVIASGTRQGIINYLNSQESRIADLRKAIADLVGTGLFNRQEKNRDRFVSRYSQLGDLPGLMFDQYYAAVGAGDDPSRVYKMADGTNITDLPADEFVSSMANSLAGWIVGAWESGLK